MEIRIFDKINTDARYIRNTVFIEEQGFEREYDEIDSFATHIVIYDGTTALGTCRVFFDEALGCYHTGRIAVLKEHRGKGLGRVLVTEAEKVAKSKGGKDIYIGGQVRVSDFYVKLGYTPYGDVYMDEGVPHIGLKKSL
jgi:predicted GNAT family N-acyltransferase